MARILTDVGFDVPAIPRDRKLFLPSPGWLDAFAHWMFGRRNLFRAEAWDCDDFAMWAVVEAAQANADSRREIGNAFLYATFMYHKPVLDIPAGGHSANIVYCDDEKLWLFEPQNGRSEVLDCNGITPFFALL